MEDTMHPESSKKYKVIASIAIITILGLTGTLIYGYQVLNGLKLELLAVRTELEATQTQLKAKEDEGGELVKRLEEIKLAYSLSEENGAELLNLLTEEKTRNDSFAKQINSMNTTVDKLDKLSKTDPELLKKYSKVFFLNENYMPGTVVEIPEEFRANTNEKEYIHEKVSPFLLKLLKAAERDNIHLRVVSAYRSFDEQKSLKNAYSVQYGTGANAFSADQGYSEHQLATTIDFSTKETNPTLDGFEKTEAYTWLTQHAHIYGFTLSYPKGNTYYVYEPWHWRFVGRDLAGDLHADGKYFYDLDERKIDEYLISLFD